MFVCAFVQVGVGSSTCWVIVLKEENLLTKLALLGKSHHCVCWLCCRASLRLVYKTDYFFPLLYFDVPSLQLSLCWALNRPLVPYTPSMTFIIQPFLEWHPPHTHPNLPSSLFHHTILLCWRVRRQVPIATRHFCWPRPRFAWQICRMFLQTHAHMQTHAAGCIWADVHLPLACGHLIIGQP